ncbi:hypothetical protein H4R26_002962 [Coemansia thaxteri]|uniref:NADPH--hemoprotein reductase n=1 Tax=Coemansia thaxteri TaxID=2663907 RepID=A0A9W8EI13_9FUNG|nr:hypothetical protein H4R26_002962 [Coemansia thaxteri]
MKIKDTADVGTPSIADPLVPVRRASYLRPAFIEQLRPLAVDAYPISASAAGGGSGGGDGSNNSSNSSSNDPTRLQEHDFVASAFDEPIRNDVLNTLLASLVRRSHVLLYAEDPWSEGYSIPLLSSAADKVGMSLTALDIPDWSVLTSRIDPVLEDLTIVSHPYSPPPDLEVDSNGGDGGSSANAGRGMSFFAGINRRRQNDEGDTLSEQLYPRADEPARGRNADDSDAAAADEDGGVGTSGRPFSRSVDSLRAQLGFGGSKGPGSASGDRLESAEEEGNDPELSREMMANPLSREATERLDRVLGDFIASPAIVGGVERPRMIVLKHLGDLLNTRIGYTLLSRLVFAAAKHNSQSDVLPVVVVGLMHPSWFHPDTPPPGIPPFDVNPATPVALMPKEDRPPAFARGIGEIVEGLMGDEGQRSANGRMGVQFVQMGGTPMGARLSRTVGSLLNNGTPSSSAPSSGHAFEELPLFLRIGIPPPAHIAASMACDMRQPDFTVQSLTPEPIPTLNSQPVVGSLRQAVVADQCLDRNARVIRNICLLYKVPGLTLSDQEAAHLANLASGPRLSDTVPGDENPTIFSRESLYDESALLALPKQPRKNTWHLDYRPLKTMLRSLPDDIAKRYFFGETFLHRWISLAQALAVRETFDLDSIRQNPAILMANSSNAFLASKHLSEAWTQLLESHISLRRGMLASPADHAFDDAEPVEGSSEADTALLTDDGARANDSVDVASDTSLLPVHRLVDFSEVGIGRKVDDDMDTAPTMAKLEEPPNEHMDGGSASAVAGYRQWSDISKEMEPSSDDEYAGSDCNASGSGIGGRLPTVLSPQRRIQLAKRNLTEYEQRLVGSVVSPQSIPTGFSQVCVKPETVTTLQEIITLPMLRPEYFSKGVLRRYGISGILLFGPPGTGKTMLAKAVAKESGSVVLNIRASDIYDKYVGEGEKLAEAVFTLARKLAPCVIFIDEVDALFSARSSGEQNKFRRDIMNQIMSEWDGINTQRKKIAAPGDSKAGGAYALAPPPQVMVMAATNRPFDLDDAILRRLPRRILVDLPGEADRARIMQIHLKGEELDGDVDLAALAKQAESFSGSDLKNLCVAAALAALRERVREEVAAAGTVPAVDGSSSGGDLLGASLIDQLKSTRRPAVAAGHHHGKARAIKLAARHFEAALKKVAPSSSDQMESLVELRKWDKIYGDGAQERNRRAYSIGFAGVAASSSSASSLASLVWYYTYHTLDWGFRQTGRTASFVHRNVYPVLGLLAATGVLINFGVGGRVSAGSNNTLDDIGNETMTTAATAAAGIEWADMVIVSGVVVGAATFLFRKTLFGGKGRMPELTIAQKAALVQGKPHAVSAPSEYNADKDFVFKMRKAGKNVVIFYGSQTGTAEDFATRLAKDIQSASVRPLVLDPELFDWQCLAALADDELAIFVLATAGEGEPTDNMEAWFNALASDRETPDDSELPEFRQPSDKADFDEAAPLQGVSYAMFGLGNNTYEQFNHHARVVDGRMQALGAGRIGERGEGDDDADIEEDFARWKEATLPLIRKFLGSSTPLQASDSTAAPEPTWKVLEMGAKKVWTKGEFYEEDDEPVTSFDARHPFLAPVSAAAELTPTADRHVLHVEVDLAGSGMRYESGDHIGVYPTNAEEEVDLVLNALGLLAKADTPIAVRATDPFAAQQSLFPVDATTYRAAFRHYLEITGSVPRAQIKSLVLPYARSAAARSFLGPLADDKDAHAAVVTAGCLSLARLLNAVHEVECQAGVGADERLELPVEAAFELCPRLQARLYSISSSGKVNPERPSITTVVLQYDAKVAGAPSTKLGARRCGVATNYLLGALRYLRGDRAETLDPSTQSLRAGCLLSENQSLPGAVDSSALAPVYDLKSHALQTFTLQPAPGTVCDGSGSSKRALAMPVFIRKSLFRLPADPSTPVIMIGPGTGLAPMRGFIQERARLARERPERTMGTALLFFGARTEAHDFMYREELEARFSEIKQAAPQSQIITAFSRDQPQKIYVQHRLAEHAELVYQTLLCGQQKLGGPSKAHVYVCGDAKSMAKDVAKALASLIAEREGVTEDVASKWVSEMRRLSRYQEDVWS